MNKWAGCEDQVQTPVSSSCLGLQDPILWTDNSHPPTPSLSRPSLACLSSDAGIDLENIVYYKDDTHYFVMTAKKQSLLDKGVILHVSRGLLLDLFYVSGRVITKRNNFIV